MATFKTPLPRLLAQVLTHALNEMIRLDHGDQIYRQLTQLEGRRVVLQLEGMGIDLHFQGHNSQVEVRAHPPQHSDVESADTRISGTPQALLAMAIPDWAASTSSVTIDGNAQVAQALEQLMRKLDPDWESLFVERFGIVLGHQLFQWWTRTLETGQTITQVSFDQASHYLREESQMVVSSNEFSRFSRAVDELGEAIDRLESNAQRRGLL